MKVRAAAVTVLAATGLMFGAGLAAATPTTTPPPSQGDSLSVILTALLGLLGTGSSTGGGADSGIG